MAKNLDHSTPSNKPTSKRQSFENSVERFLERHHLAGNHAADDEHIADEAEGALDQGVAAEGSMVEVEIVDPIEKTMEAPLLVVDEDEGTDAPEQDVAADPIESTVESPFLVIPDEGDVYEGDVLVDEDPAADAYDDEYYDDDYYDEGYYYDEYEQPEQRRGVRRGVVAALVAGVAVASFVAGGLAVRFFLQTPAAPIEAPAPVEVQASLTEKTDEDADKVVAEKTDQDKSKSDTTTIGDTKSDTTTNTNSKTNTKKNTTKKNNDTSTKSDAPSYDTGDDTTDDSGSSSSKKKTTQDDEWRWDLDDNSGNSISYDQDNQEMTVDYDGYRLTVPVADLVDQTERTYGNNKTYDYTDRTNKDYSTRDNSGYRSYDYGSDGSGTDWTRKLTERDYSRKYGTWS